MKEMKMDSGFREGMDGAERSGNGGSGKVNMRELPVGFALSLGMNGQAMERFSEMSEAEKSRYIEESRHVTSKLQMQMIVDRIAGME